MTQTSTHEAQDLASADLLIYVIITLLAPMFIVDADGDIGFARAAALQTVNAYRARNHASLLAVGKIIGFGLATLGSLSLSMAENLSIPEILSLRSNANALDRSGDRNERALRAWQAEAAAEPSGTGFDEAAVRAGVAALQQRLADVHAVTPAPAPPPRAEQVPPQPSEQPAAPRVEPAPAPAAAGGARREQPDRPQWSAEIARMAAEEMAAPNLPPPERSAVSARAAILSSTANSLLCGTPEFRPAPIDLAGMMPRVPR